MRHARAHPLPVSRTARLLALIYYGDVRVGTIARRVGNPFDTDPWEWTCGFYPGSHPGECTSDASETFDQARTEFEAAWAVFLSKRTEADFQKWRDERDWTERKYAQWDAGKRLEPPTMERAGPPIVSGRVRAARYSTCTAPRRC